MKVFWFSRLHSRCRLAIAQDIRPSPPSPIRCLLERTGSSKPIPIPRRCNSTFPPRMTPPEALMTRHRNPRSRSPDSSFQRNRTQGGRDRVLLASTGLRLQKSQAQTVAYRVNANVSLKLRDFAKVAPHSSAVGGRRRYRKPVHQLHAGRYGRSEIARRAGCIPASAESANAIASASGRAVGELSYASVDTFENVRVFQPMMKRAMGMAAAEAAPAPTEEFTPQSVSVTAHVNAMFTLR